LYARIKTLRTLVDAVGKELGYKHPEELLKEGGMAKDKNGKKDKNDKKDKKDKKEKKDKKK